MYRFLPWNKAIQKLEPNASTWSSLVIPAGATNKLGQLSLYRLPSFVRCRKSPAKSCQNSLPIRMPPLQPLS